jgi:hypothetical protein
MVANTSLCMRRMALAAFVGAVAALLAPVGYAMQVAPIEPVVWETADGGNGHTYMFVPLSSRTTWSQANRLAELITLPDGSEGYLATIDSAEERAFVREAVLPDDWGNKKSAVWIAPENQFMLVSSGQHSHGHGGKGWGWFKAKSWDWGSRDDLAPEEWSYAKWRNENEPDDSSPIGKRFLTKWFRSHGHHHGHGWDRDCNDGHDHFQKPKIIGLIVEFDPADVPEPATALLSAFGIALLGLLRRRN